MDGRERAVVLYVAAVRMAVSDQAMPARQALVADARAHLDELDDEALAHLGPPSQWAEGYRLAAGLEPVGRWRRWLGLPLRWRALSILGPLVLVLVVAALVYRRSYQPLEVHVFGIQSNHWAAPEEHGPPVLTYQDDATYDLMVALSNHGRFGVEVSLPPDDPTVHDALHAAEIFDITDACCVPRPRDRVEGAIHLDPGETLSIAIRYRMDDCEHYEMGSSVRIESLDLRARVLAVDHHVSAPPQRRLLARGRDARPRRTHVPVNHQPCDQNQLLAGLAVD